ncbi:hypothetical protein Tco_0359337 [Tanacetum coccineum]
MAVEFPTDRLALDEYMGVWFRSVVTDAAESRSSAVIFRKELEERIESRRLVIDHLEKVLKCIRKKRETMEWLPKSAELEMVVGSQKWLDMMVLYCRRSAHDDREFARQMNRFCGETICVCEDMVSFVQELESLSGVTVTTKMAKFLNETMAKDDGRVLQLHNLEKGSGGKGH